jgi:arabinan endo-1,5-alpha-L-arabinosidase
MSVSTRSRATPRTSFAFACTLLLLSAACRGTTQTVAPIEQKPGADQYVNPVIATDFPDPSVIKASDGYYYAYATQTTGVKLQVARSQDLVTWTKLGEAMPVKPTWATASLDFWAPDVHQREGGTFVMYFSSPIDADKKIHPDDKFCIGMATATSGAGPFTDVGAPVVCGPGFRTIDPMGFDDPQTGKHYLYWGSDAQPIVVKELADDRRTFVDPAAAPTPLVSPSGVSGSYDANLVEGPWVTYRAPYYYLYFSGNNCCGTGAHYAVMVARSSSPTGPFQKLAGASGAAQPILQAGDKWIGPGHNSTVADAMGTEWMVYHAIDVNHPYLIPGNTNISLRPMLIDRITYSNGWPTVGTNGSPTQTPQTRPAATMAPD